MNVVCGEGACRASGENATKEARVGCEGNDGLDCGGVKELNVLCAVRAVPPRLRVLRGIGAIFVVFTTVVLDIGGDKCGGWTCEVGAGAEKLGRGGLEKVVVWTVISDWTHM